MPGIEELLVVLAIIAIGLALILPVAIVVLMIKVLHRQKESADQAAAQFKRLHAALIEQKALLSELLTRSTMSGSPQEPQVAPSPQSLSPPEPLRAPEPSAAEAPAEVPKSASVSSPVRLFQTPDATSPPRPAASARPVPPPPSRFESAVREILLKIWNWIIVGDELRPTGVSMEYAIASTWLLRVGVVILVMGVGFFLKYSIDRNFIGPTARVGLTILTGVAMVAFGTRLLGKKYHTLGLGILGGGIATLYFAAFAAFHFYHLIGMFPAFAMMALITFTSGILAVRFNSMLVAILGILGGYFTPVLLSTGVVNFPGLFSYELLLGFGVLGVSYKKKWHLLGYLSFICTYALFFAAMQKYEDANFWQVMPFLTAFFVLFSTMVFIFNLFTRTKSTLLDAIGLLINAGIYFAVSYTLVSQFASYHWVAAVSLGLAAFYVAHVWYCLIRRVLDRELLFCFIALSAFFLAVTMPLALSPQWITVSWAIQAFVMLWVAGKLESKFLRQVAYLLYLIVIGRFCFIDLDNQYGHGTGAAADIALKEYFWFMLERLVVFGIPIASLAGAFRLLKNPVAAAGLAVDRANDMAAWVRDRWAIRATMVGVAAMAFLFLHLELNRTFNYLFPPLRLPVLSCLWIAMCAFLLYEYITDHSKVILGVLILFMALLLAKLFAFDLPSWNVDNMIYADESYSFLGAGMRLVDFGAIIAFLYFGFRLLAGDAAAERTRWGSGAAALVLLFIFLSLEVNTFLTSFVPGLRAGGVSILWSLFAISCLLGGIWKDRRALRYVALALFAVVCWKVFFSDLERLDALYRIVAFLILGVLVLCGSFIYLKYRTTFATKPAKTEDKAL